LQVAKPFWRLTRGGETLAYLRPDGKAQVPELDGHFTTEAVFEPLPAFETVRHLFEREVLIAGEEGDAEQAEWFGIWEELAAPGLFVESGDGQDRWDILWIHVQNGRAWWWPLGSSPRTILRRCNQSESDDGAVGGDK
jgi:hypothetical protein